MSGSPLDTASFAATKKGRFSKWKSKLDEDARFWLEMSEGDVKISMILVNRRIPEIALERQKFNDAEPAMTQKESYKKYLEPGPSKLALPPFKEDSFVAPSIKSPPSDYYGGGLHNVRNDRPLLSGQTIMSFKHDPENYPPSGYQTLAYSQRAVLDDDGSDGDTDEGLAIYPPKANPIMTTDTLGQGLSRNDVAVRLARYMDDPKLLNGTYGDVWSLTT
ncbi:hypothetical protein IFM46972_07436 [Aspergillus udagawae]|uniref:Uncharacterized protein n=1 Tax=Aspergillus udagawae TaxID=91492 RepID=A0A8H3P2P2_9EURO|nr:hypothetical protein IFM46972_07436 [Aspergillus udagawae]